MSIKIYVENKCYQCWLCKNRVGSDYHGFPECKVTDKYMYEIYEEPCHYFEPTERVKDLIIKSTDVQRERIESIGKMSKYINLDNPHKMGRDKFGNVIYYIQPDITLNVIQK